MRGQRDAGGAERPDVQIMHIGHPRWSARKDITAEELTLEGRRPATNAANRAAIPVLAKIAATISKLTMGSNRLQPVNIMTAPDRRTPRTPRVAEHVDVGTAPVQVAMAARMQQQGAQAVDDDSAGCDAHDDRTRHRRRGGNPAHGLPGDGPQASSSNTALASAASTEERPNPYVNFRPADGAPETWPSRRTPIPGRRSSCGRHRRPRRPNSTESQSRPRSPRKSD